MSQHIQEVQNFFAFASLAAFFPHHKDKEKSLERKVIFVCWLFSCLHKMVFNFILITTTIMILMNKEHYWYQDINK